MSRWNPSPGPWFYKGPTMADPSAWVYAADDRTVCELNDNRDEYEANARLIAAAPDLLAALKGAVAYIDEFCQDDIREAEDVAWTLSEAKQLIARAEGGRP